MEMGREAEGMLLLELARAQAESAYAQNPLDADNLARWGGALMELSQFQGPRELKIMLLDAASKLEEALVIDPKKHHAMWCLVNAHTTHGLMIPDIKEAEVYFMKAAIYFQQAIEEDPGNEVYMKSLEIIEKSLIIASIPNIIGWLVISFSKDISFLYMGRLLEGFGVGIISYTVPVYIAEIVTQNMRGSLGAVNQLAVTIGTMLVYLIGMFVNWRVLAIIGMPSSKVLMYLCTLQPDNIDKHFTGDNSAYSQEELEHIRDVFADVAFKFIPI